MCVQTPEPCWHWEDSSIRGRMSASPPGWKSETGRTLKAELVVLYHIFPLSSYHRWLYLLNAPCFPSEPWWRFQACVAPSRRIGLQVHSWLHRRRWVTPMARDRLLSEGYTPAFHICNLMRYFKLWVCVSAKPRERRQCTPLTWWRLVCRTRGPRGHSSGSWCTRTALTALRRCFATRVSLASTEVGHVRTAELCPTSSGSTAPIIARGPVVSTATSQTDLGWPAEWAVCVTQFSPSCFSPDLLILFWFLMSCFFLPNIPNDMRFSCHPIPHDAPQVWSLSL